ncbi:MAG TPA: DUF2157 domain-containing protein [Thermoanaerobaculia bacterium]|nr:DUF2157 domain-containing protein [Thermoanaerobaculia bacterium]
MLSLQTELESLRPILGDARTDALLARDRREIFSVHPELRICAWLGATLLAAAAGLVLKNNLERIGPLALSILIGAAAAGCYVWTWLRRARATIVDDYVLLLGALLVSADVAFIESQFHLFDGAWRRHLFLLAVVHAIGAYAYGSRMLLSLSIVAFAGWIGFDRNLRPPNLVVPAMITAALLIVWREIDRRWRGDAFSRTFEHFAANIALFGGLTLFDRDEAVVGMTTIAIAAVVAWWGVRTRHEPFVLYAMVYAVIAFDAFLIDQLRDAASILLLIVVTSVIAVVALIVVHKRFAEERE